MRHIFIVILLIIIAAGLCCKKEDPAPAATPTPVEVIPEPPVAKSYLIPKLQPARKIMVGEFELCLGQTASPEVFDWDKDGKKDLIVGTFEYGKLMFFSNMGTDEDPVFEWGEYLQADGRDISVGFV
ncbi:MAG: hypothetical protein GY869_32510 [Planctomycetes bacterium]|nr:hypothetical protein [Planctomycetota bacterium]